MLLDSRDLNSENLYRQDLNHELLDADQERRLLAMARRGSKTAIDKLIASNQRMVMAMALRYHRSSIVGDQDLMDLIQFGNIGLIEAISRWDEARQVRFSTYATWWVRAVIRRSAMKTGSSHTQSAREGELLFAIRKAIARFTSIHHREPTLDEIAAGSKISLNLVTQLMPMLSECIRLDADYGDDRVFLDIVPAETISPETEVEEHELVEQLSRMVASMPPRYAQVIALHYGLFGNQPQSLTAIARRFNVSRSRIGEIKKLALMRLRSLLSSS
jgi:RNA polymerase primary sigma factor